ncbi:PH domain-containing protein [Actinomycetospora termitidis]|uniref:PH domain-containing protein n=1 Tax=Actinomycetospora termitidis TaxID=3053470 RepID=A0ABT7MK29_9PSEU|nr:PH domain-containing protein [Actinomycetospora sp. Odt1-22]MDL5160277.1 PH domain-containing protein [Actinomycetospora sp. Odt1-22]
MAYPERLLVAGERVSVHVRPHWRMLVLPAVLPPVVAFVGAWLVAVARPTPWFLAVLVAVGVVAVGVVGWFSLAPATRWRATHFVVTDRRILVREGVFSRTGIVVVGRSITSVRTVRSGADRLLGAGTLVVGVDDAREPWRFDGLARIVRVAAEVERMAERRGGLDPDRWGTFDDDEDDEDDGPEDEAWDDDEPDGPGAPDEDVVDAEWEDAEPSRFPRLRRLSARRRELPAGR